MQTCMHTYLQACIHTQTDTHTHTHNHTHTHTRTHARAETLGATMAKSSMDSLRRRTKHKFTDMVYMGPGRRVCFELSSLGVTCQR